MSRGVKLCQLKVKQLAYKKGYRDFTSFELAYIREFGDIEGIRPTAPKIAWNGVKRLEKQKADYIAQLIGLIDHTQLLVTTESPWDQLINKATNREPFVKLKLLSEGELGLINPESHDHLRKIKKNDQFHLDILGSYGEAFMAIFQSDKIKYQLAPISVKNYNSVFLQSSKKLRYPSSGSIPFHANYDAGWRQLTIVKSSLINIPPKSINTGYEVSNDELNTFAFNFIGNSYVPFSVFQLQFLLTD